MRLALLLGVLLALPVAAAPLRVTCPHCGALIRIEAPAPPLAALVPAPAAHPDLARLLPPSPVRAPVLRSPARGRPCGCPLNCDGYECKSYPGTTCARGDAAGCNCHRH